MTEEKFSNPEPSRFVFTIPWESAGNAAKVLRAADVPRGQRLKLVAWKHDWRVRKIVTIEWQDPEWAWIWPDSSVDEW